jgi:hypothetical protein
MKKYQLLATWRLPRLYLADKCADPALTYLQFNSPTSVKFNWSLMWRSLKFMVQHATPTKVKPDLCVQDIRQLDFIHLAHNFEGIIFDKDNTLTVPHELTLYPPLQVTVLMIPGCTRSL